MSALHGQAVTLVDHAKGFLPLIDPCFFLNKFFRSQVGE